MLADPIVRMTMAADSIDEKELFDMMLGMAEHLRRSSWCALMRQTGQALLSEGVEKHGVGVYTGLVSPPLPCARERVIQLAGKIANQEGVNSDLAQTLQC